MKPSSVVIFICLAACSLAIAQTKRALLIGIDTYEPPGTRVKVPAGTPAEGRFAAGITFANLQGPTHDVDAMRDLLTSAKFGFPNDDQHIHILRDSAATHDAILAAMKDAQAKGLGAVALNGVLIDAASIRQAEQIVKQMAMIRERTS